MRNQGVVVTLIVFIVLTLVLGVGVYFGFKDLKKNKLDLASAQSELNNAKTEVATLKADFASVKTKLGYETLGDAKKIVEQMSADVQTALGQAGANATYKDAVAKLAQNLAAKNAEIADCVKERDEAIATANAEIKKSEQQKADFDRQAADARKENEKNLADARESYQKLTSSFNEQTQEFDKLKSQTKDAIAEANQETANFKESAARLAENNLDLSNRIDQLSKAEFERADAEVIYADQIGKTVRLNVGSKDGVRPLTEFKIYSFATPDLGGAEPKGSVQVVQVIDEHVCEAKIVEDELTDPIQQGDLVYTPLWRPGEFVRYALDYHLDINGDGFSDLDEIVNLIQSSGAEVAAFIDNKGVVHGEITPDVFRIVVANERIIDPEWIDKVPVKDFVLDDDAKAKLKTSESEFVDSAEKNGVRQMRLADFLISIGYKETPQISRYRSEGDVLTHENNAPNSQVSTEATSPVYKDESAAEESLDLLAPVVKDAGQVSDASDNAGNVQFRRRAPKN